MNSDASTVPLKVQLPWSVPATSSPALCPNTAGFDVPKLCTRYAPENNVSIATKTIMWECSIFIVTAMSSHREVVD